MTTNARNKNRNRFPQLTSVLAMLGVNKHTHIDKAYTSIDTALVYNFIDENKKPGVVIQFGLLPERKSTTPGVHIRKDAFLENNSSLKPIVYSHFKDSQGDEHGYSMIYDVDNSSLYEVLSFKEKDYLIREHEIRYQISLTHDISEEEAVSLIDSVKAEHLTSISNEGFTELDYMDINQPIKQKIQSPSLP